ncbi:MAG: hypothetical protein A2W25_09245 [candidate division Zixibacteria bacterium RBG_16_53_22]|nr:MAG: hypothetical protein A2W25_09245 [candidate division Zixibacteria bacterium RBG_16_53_22]
MLNSRFTLPILLALNFLIRFLGAVRPLKVIDGHTIPDDAYICLTIARNIARGLGPLYGFDFTNGFQPLYVFLMTPVFWLFPGDYAAPVHAGLIVGVLFDTVTLYLIYKLVAGQSKSQATAILISLAWILAFSVIRTTLNGMETAISMFFIVLAYYYFQRFRDSLTDMANLRHGFVIGIILGLAMLARIDNVFLAAILLPAIFMIGVRQAGGFARPIQITLAIVLGMGLIYLPWIIYQYYYTGSIIPSSGMAVRHITLAAYEDSFTTTNFLIATTRMGLAAIVKDNNPIIILTAVLCIGLMTIGKRGAFRLLLGQIKRHNIMLAFSLSLFMAYIFYIFGFWYFRRYLYPVTFLLLLYLASAIDIFLSSLTNERKARISGIMIAVFLVTALLLSPTAKIIYWDNETEPIGYMNLGIWARSNFADSTVVGGCQTGALGYFADNLKVVNLDGVVNKRCYDALSQKQAMAYIREAGIEYFIDWMDFHDFLVKHSENYGVDDLRFFYTIKGFKAFHNEWHVYQVWGER